MSAEPLPHSLEAEKSVIGGVLLDNSAFHHIQLQPEDFYAGKHTALWTVVSRILTTGGSADLVTVIDALRDEGRLETIGGSVYVAELADYSIEAGSITHHAGIVSSKSRQRQVHAVGRQLLQDAAADPETAVGQGLAALQSIGQSTEKIWLTLDDQAAAYQQYINTAGESSFFTGYQDIDGIINNGRGIAPGEVLMVVGYSGTFKSAFLQNMLLNNCRKNGKTSLFFSLEMPATLVYQRTVQIALEQYTYNIESGYAGTKPGYIENTREELKRLHADKLIVNPMSALSVEQIEHQTRIARAQHGEVGVVAIDYLGLMASEHKSEYERISYCAEQSKVIAKRLNVPVVILTQVSREAAKAGKIEMHSAKGSGAVEASGDYMLSLARNQDNREQIIIEILKNRNGEANLRFVADLEAKYLKFRGLNPYDPITAKNAERGRGRLRNVKQEKAPDYCPF